MIKAIWDGIRLLNDTESMKSLIERIKKFVRKLRKSHAMKEQFENIQKLNELPQLQLIKDSEVALILFIKIKIPKLQVRWSSTYQMLDRFLLNRQAVNLLCAQVPCQNSVMKIGLPFQF